ncbi:MAG: hypothetical protein AAGA92_00305 [Planctomycetota bacterium]
MLLAAAAGCQKGPDPEVVAQHRQRLMMDDEPDGILTVIELREAFTGTSSEPEAGAVEVTETSESTEQPSADEPASPTTPEGPVVIVGRVGGLTNPWQETRPEYPFVPGEAAFFLADAGAVAENEASGHVHAPGEECPFCAAHAGDNSAMLAMIRFKQDGKPITIEATDLLDLKPLDTVVVRGEASFTGDAETGMLVVEADGIYIRR